MNKIGVAFLLLISASGLFAGGVSYEPCNLPEMKEQASCTTIEVFENRETKQRKIPIHVAILRATGK